MAQLPPPQYEQQFQQRFQVLTARLLGLTAELDTIAAQFPSVRLSGIDLLGPEVQIITVSAGFGGRVLGTQRNVRVTRIQGPPLRFEVNLRADPMPDWRSCRWLGGPTQCTLYIRQNEEEQWMITKRARYAGREEIVHNCNGGPASVEDHNISDEHMVFYIIDIHQQAENQRFLDQCAPNGTVHQALGHIMGQLPVVRQELTNIDIDYKQIHGEDTNIEFPEELFGLWHRVLTETKARRVMIRLITQEMPTAVTTSYGDRQLRMI